MAVVNPTEGGFDQNYSRPSPEPSGTSPNSTPPMSLSTLGCWETPHTTTYENTSYSEHEPRRVHWTSPLDETVHSEGQPRRIYLLSRPAPPSTPRKIKKKLEMAMSLPKRGGVSQLVCEACGQRTPQRRTFRERLLRIKNSANTKIIHIPASKFIILFTYL